MKDSDSVTALDAATAAGLLSEARAAAREAYAPYSGFRVGAAVLARGGAVFRGVNVENASLGLGVCAERVALATAIASGERDIIAVAVACIDAPPGAPLEERVPCGACRQWLQELAPGARILIQGEERSFLVAELLPMAFALGRKS